MNNINIPVRLTNRVLAMLTTIFGSTIPLTLSEILMFCWPCISV